MTVQWPLADEAGGQYFSRQSATSRDGGLQRRLTRRPRRATDRGGWSAGSRRDTADHDAGMTYRQEDMR